MVATSGRPSSSRQAEQLDVGALLLRQVVVLDLDVVAIVEDRAVLLHHLAGALERCRSAIAWFTSLARQPESAMSPPLSSRSSSLSMRGL